MADFMGAALPWILMALLLAVFFAWKANRKTDNEDMPEDGHEGEDENVRKDADDAHSAEGMAVGMCLGVAMSTALHVNVGIGIAVGMALGLLVGSQIDKEQK